MPRPRRNVRKWRTLDCRRVLLGPYFRIVLLRPRQHLIGRPAPVTQLTVDTRWCRARWRSTVCIMLLTDYYFCYCNLFIIHTTNACVAVDWDKIHHALCTASCVTQCIIEISIKHYTLHLTSYSASCSIQCIMHHTLYHVSYNASCFLCHTLHYAPYTASCVIHCIKQHTMHHVAYSVSCIIHCIMRDIMHHASYTASSVIQCIMNHTLHYISYTVSCIIQCIMWHTMHARMLYVHSLKNPSRISGMDMKNEMCIRIVYLHAVW